MDAQEFITYLEDPGRLAKESLPEIESLSRRFPYCQSLHILYLLNLRATDQVMFNEQLKTTAAYIADRKRLKELINNLNTAQETKEQGTGEQRSKEQGTSLPAGGQGTEELEMVHNEAAEADAEPVVPVVEKDEEMRLMALKKIVEDRLSEIQKEKEATEKANREKEERESMTKEEIIDRFIEEEPSISRPKTDFFDPVKVARKSQTDEDNIVTETLARIHLKQGNIAKAVEIYRKLSLKFPEKSSYFAAQIDKITSEH